MSALLSSALSVWTRLLVVEPLKALLLILGCWLSLSLWVSSNSPCLKTTVLILPSTSRIIVFSLLWIEVCSERVRGIELLISLLTLGYNVEFSDYGGSLQIKLTKVINNSDIDEFSIKQVVPYNYLNNISKMERLFDYIQIKLTEIIKENSKWI